MPTWLELSLETDDELAEAISEAIHPYVEGGVALEQIRDWPMETEWKADASGWMVDADGVRRQPISSPDSPAKVIVRAYLPMDESLESRRSSVEQALRYLNMIRPVAQPAYREIKQEDWAESWKVAFKPLRIGRRILIRPSWIAPEDVQAAPDDLVLALDPGLAFGTGLHPTTQMCALALDERLAPGATVLDVGCGSGILSVLAAKLGASAVDGVDTDPEAVRATRDNAAANGVAGRVRAAPGSWDAPDLAPRYDVVVANILAPVIVKLLDAGLGHKGDMFVFSGILETQAEDVIAAFARQGDEKSARLRLAERKQIADWVCLVAQRVTAGS